jgi:hypothetical protein
MSWERLTALADAHTRREAENMLLFMTACQGDEKSWTKQREILIKRLKAGLS